MTSHLIPVQRPDKNGHMVTRWVRPDSAASKGKHIPSVQANPSMVLRDTVKDRCLTAIDGGNYEDTNLKPQRDLFKHLKNLSDTTLDTYLTAMDGELDKNYADLLLSVLNNGDSDMKAKYVLAIAKLDNETDAEWSDYSKGTYTYDNASRTLTGLYMYEWSGFTPPEDITNESDPAVAQALGLITVVQRLWETGDIEDYIDETVSIDDGNLVSLVLERPGDAEEIASIAHDVNSLDGRLVRFVLENPKDAEEIVSTVRGTGTTDINRVRDMMATSSNSLKSGVL